MFGMKPKSLDDILGSFNKTLNDLEALITSNDAKASANSAKIEDLFTENNALIAEAAKAERVVSRIKELVA